MIEFRIEKNDAGQRLDRFLRKYLVNASLGQIYKMIRKDVKVDGKRPKEKDILQEGAILKLYISDDELEALKGKKKRVAAKKQFKIVYEDDNMLIVSKPFGLLTHGDGREKKNHLANQVVDYLISTGKFDPSASSTFTPSPVNRLDRNTTGLVIFGKNAECRGEQRKGKQHGQHVVRPRRNAVKKAVHIFLRRRKKCRRHNTKQRCGAYPDNKFVPLCSLLHAFPP